MNSPSPFGSRTRTRTLLALRLRPGSCPRDLARLLGTNLSAVQRALGSLERDGVAAGRTVGRIRLYRINPLAFARTELERYLDRLLEPEAELRARISGLRRRPRRTTRPL
jgi:DNA-binding transcriptional ArsR family regulator